MEINRITDAIIGAAIEVHRRLGPGLLETAYQTCMAREMAMRGINFENQKQLNLEYKGVFLDRGYRLDFLVEQSVIVELKTVDELQPIHEAQLIAYLKLSGCRIGLLLNFNVPVLKNGLKRIIL